MDIAGWKATSNRLNTMPGLSLICGNVKLCLSINPWKSSSSPVHATPTKLTAPANFFAAASTEGASRLQALQVGAQNQNSVGLPANVAVSSSPPPTSGAVNCSAAGAATTSPAAAVSAGAGPAAATSIAATSIAGTSDARDVSAAGLGVAAVPSLVDPPPHAAISRLLAASAGRNREPLIELTVVVIGSRPTAPGGRVSRRFRSQVLFPGRSFGQQFWTAVPDSSSGQQ